MFIPLASNQIALVAVAGGMISALLNTGIEDLLNTLIVNKTLIIGEMLLKCLIASFTVGLVLSIIYYAFVVYGFSESSMSSIQIIVLFTFYFGIANPLLGVALKLLYSKLLAKNDV
ncbi:MAG: hypothetical protein AAF298_12100 [Cyanobacteria bacterium P01_A01_bin.40]